VPHPRGKSGQQNVEETWRKRGKTPHPRGEPEEQKRRRTWEDEGG